MPPDYTDDIPHIVAALDEELTGRLEASLSEKDLVAINSALAKAATRGLILGINARNDELRRKGFDIYAQDPAGGDVVESDPWADLFGESSEADP